MIWSQGETGAYESAPARSTACGATWGAVHGKKHILVGDLNIIYGGFIGGLRRLSSINNDNEWLIMINSDSWWLVVIDGGKTMPSLPPMTGNGLCIPPIQMVIWEMVYEVVFYPH